MVQIEEETMTFMDFPTPRELILTCGTTRIGLIPDIDLISHFQVDSWQVLYRPMHTGNVKRWGLPLMIPNFSRLKNGIFQEKGTTLPIHGFGRMLPWTVTEQGEASATLQLQSSEATRSNYPYEFTFTATITAGEGSLTYTVTMENRSDEVMPIAPGFHPYFTVTQSDKAKLATSGLPDFDPKAYQWDTQTPDTPYPFPHKVTVRIPRRGVLTITEQPVNGQYSLSSMQVWSEPINAPDHEFVCFEPIVTSEDGLNRPQDRINIPPHETRQFTLQLTAQPF
jgi:galactose mutarotase-like enzyme